MSRKLILKNGDRFYYLTLLEIEVKKGKNGIYGLWKCDCNNEKVILNSKVLSGHTKSCSCFQKNKARNNIKHGHSRKHNESPEYSVWQHMKDRCNNPNNKDYHHYGSRGIKVCDRWMNSFENFLEDMKKRPDGNYSIERIDNNREYEPLNCKWALKIDQIKNRRNTIKVLLENNHYCLKDACKILNLSYSRVLYEYKKKSKLPQQLILINND